MKIRRRKSDCFAVVAYTLPEVMLAVFVLAIMLVSLYGGFSAGFAVVQLARENLRATQIMVQKMEDIRIYNWSQITNSTFLKNSFVDYYVPSGTNNNTAGAYYQGFITTTNLPIGIPAVRFEARSANCCCTLVVDSAVRQTR